MTNLIYTAFFFQIFQTFWLFWIWRELARINQHRRGGGESTGGI